MNQLIKQIIMLVAIIMVLAACTSTFPPVPAPREVREENNSEAEGVEGEGGGTSPTQLQNKTRT